MIAGLLLAAGLSSRFGSDKLCAKIDGRAVIRWSVRALEPTDVTYVVVPPGADALTQSLARLDVTFVVNLARREGMASSIRAGIDALPSDVSAVVIALADQPYADAAVTALVCERWRVGDVAAVATEYDDGRGHPALFGRECFDALRGLRGDIGARSVLDALGPRLGTITVPHAMPVDVDTRGTLEQLQASSKLKALPT